MRLFPPAEQKVIVQPDLTGHLGKALLLDQLCAQPCQLAFTLVGKAPK